MVFGKADWGVEVVERLVDSGDTLRIDSVKDKDSLGYTATAVGDFNGDGIADIALGARAGSLEFAGESYVVFGGKHLREGSTLALAELGEQGVVIRGEFGYDFAVDLAPAGDFNGDGRKDLLISGGSVQDDANPFPGRSFVVFGGARGTLRLGKLGEHGFCIHGGQQTQSVGGTDFNGDGFDDVVIRSDEYLYVVFGSGLEPPFIRGDANRSGDVNISDAVAILNYLFAGTFRLTCKDAGDADDSGSVQITDAVFLLGHLFSGTKAPPPPYPEAGSDPTEDSLNCAPGS